MSEIKSLSIERQLISGILKYPNKYYDTVAMLDSLCFSNSLYKTLYAVIGQFLSQSKSLDSFLITQEINKLGLKFEIDNVMDHIDSLRLISVNDDAISVLARQLRTIKERRNLISVGQKLIEAAKNAKDDEGLSSIIGRTDAIYNGAINPLYTIGDDDENLMDGLADFFIEKARNPTQSTGLLGPHKNINRICGSILKPGHYSVIAARSGFGKTMIMMDYAMKTSEANDCIVIWLDQGEMLANDLRGRIGASITDINMNLLETGKFGLVKSNMDKMLLIREKEKKIKILYKNTAGMTPHEIISTLRRMIYRYAGRHNLNKCFVVLDYIKIGMNKGNKQEYVLAAELVSMLKDFLSREEVAMLTSLQVNRLGIVNGKRSSEVNDSEESFGLTDEILRQSSHSFIWRELTLDEQDEDPESTHKLIPLKMRFWGDDGIEFRKPVKVGKRMTKNFLRFKSENFKVEELGTFREFAAMMEFKEMPKKEDKGPVFILP